MIPKIIHLCWLSGDEYPPLIQKCIDSWKKHLPDYEIWVWDTKRFDVNSVIWTKQAFESKKYAFAADYIRLFALYNYGGIYLDSDVFVYKSFDDLLDLPYFIGEDFVHLFEPAIIGCEAGMPWIGDVIERYKNRSFVKEDGNFDILSLPLVFRNQLIEKWTFKLIRDKREFSTKSDVISVLGFNFFNSRDYVGAVRFKDSYCSHCFLGSWLKPESSVKKKIRMFLPRWIVNLLYMYKYKLSDLESKQIPYEDKNEYRLNCFLRVNPTNI